jgi:hypothetical protein
MEYLVELTDVLIEITPYGDKTRLERLFAIKGNIIGMIQDQNIGPTDGFKESNNKE